MDQTFLPPKDQNENKSAVNIPSFPPVSSVPPPQPVLLIPEAVDNSPKSITNMNTQHSGQQFKLASAEVQGPKPPLVSGSNSKVSLIAIAAILIIIAAIGGYYFYTNNNSGSSNVAGVVLSPTPAETPIVNKNLDTDNDGLPDNIEEVLGTYITKADTDGDGFTDLQEIKSGYSPSIAGAAGKYTPEQWDIVKGKIKIEDRDFYEKEFGAPATPSLSPSSSPAVSLTPSPTQAPLSFICGTDTAKDIDNNIYKTVKIGDQCWLKENLKVTKNPAGVAITRYCYNNDPKICDTDGGLYDWNTTMNKSTVEGAQGICMNGWHVPKDSEWYTLENGLKDAGKTCDASRVANNWDCDSAGIKLRRAVAGGTSGFEGIYAGIRNTDGSFGNQSEDTSFWSSTDSGSISWNRNGTDVWMRSLDISIFRVYRDKWDKASGFSVRCLKD